MEFKDVVKLPKNEPWVLLKTIYHRPDKNRKGFKDSIDLVFKNMETGKRKLIIVRDPKIKAYVAKDDVPILHPLAEIERDKVDPVYLSYANIYSDIAKISGNQKFLSQCYETRNWENMRLLHTWERLFGSDVNIEDYFRMESFKYFGKVENIKLTKGFLDIEADIRKGKINFKKGNGDAPINAVTLIDAENKRIYTLLLRDRDNPLIEEFENNTDDFILEMKKKYDEMYDKFEYDISFYDTEIDLIINLFKIINFINLDFIFIWNMGFDMPYIINRIKSLGYDPGKIMSHDHFPIKTAYHSSRSGVANTIETKKEISTVTSYTTTLCQLISFAAIRKQDKKSEYDSYKLEDVGLKLVGAGKLNYNGITSLKNLTHVNYRMFVEYSIRDTMVQYSIENKVNDLELMFEKSYSTYTNMSKIFNDTIYHSNNYVMELYKLGFIKGNNQNIGIMESDEKFSAAVVGDPDLLLGTGFSIFGKRKSSRIYNNVVDFDYSSQYPSCIITHNISSTSLLGKLVLDENNVGKSERMFIEEKYDRAGGMVADLEVNEPILFCERWLNLPKAHDILSEIGKVNLDISREKFKKKKWIPNISISLRRKK